MKRFAQSTIGLALVASCGVSAAHAQGTPASDLIWSAEGDVAATFGHSSSGSGGVELGLRLSDKWEGFVEIGRMSNVTSTTTVNRARVIGDAIGATPNPVQHATYVDFGARYSLNFLAAWHPFLTAGVGFAPVHTETTFSQSGTTLGESDLANIYGVQLGLDLSGHVTKALLMVGGGVTRPFKNRYFVEGSYRYGCIFSKTGEIEGDKALNTQRLQIGVGLRF